MSIDILKARRARRKSAKLSAESTQTQHREYDKSIIKLPLTEGVGSMKVRFLINPPTKADPDNYVTKWFEKRVQHNVKFDDFNVVFDCPKSEGSYDDHDCPICEWTSELYGMEKDHKTFNKVKSDHVTSGSMWWKKLYYANVLVVQCKAKPELEGKVWILQFAHQVYEELTKVLKGDKEAEKPAINFFDMIGEDDDPCEGVNILIKAEKGDSGQTHYRATQPVGEAYSLLDVYSEDEVKGFIEKCVSLEDRILTDYEFDSYEKINNRFQTALKHAGLENVVKSKNDVQKEIHAEEDEAAPPEDLDDSAEAFKDEAEETVETEEKPKSKKSKLFDGF